VVAALLAAGANPTLADNRGQTAIVIAHQSNCQACVTALEEAVRNWKQ
jgi:ankyrin repeat protein